jgi:hypothetical protein
MGILYDIYTHCTYTCNQPCLIFEKLHCSYMWQLLYNYYKCPTKATIMLQLGTMYIHAIMPHVHVSTNHYGIHLQLVFDYVFH